MNALEMADVIKTVIGSTLGQYKLPDASLVPAFSILAESEERAYEIEPIGLEFVLLEHPRRIPRGFLGGELNVRNQWSGYLIQWPDATDRYGSAATLAAEALETHFLGNIQISSVRCELPVISQQACLIKDFAYVEQSG